MMRAQRVQEVMEAEGILLASELEGYTYVCAIIAMLCSNKASPLTSS